MYDWQGACTTWACSVFFLIDRKMATKDWNGLKGQKWNVGVGVTMTEALNDTENPTRVYVTTDGKLVMNGEVMNGVLATVSYMVFYADATTSNDDIVDAFTMRLCNGEAVENASGIVKVLDLCVEHGLVLKDQDMGMQVGVSWFEDMGVKKYSLSGVGIGQQENGIRPALFNLVLEYNAENATMRVAHHMANFDVSLIKKLGYKIKKNVSYPPCVHKAIPWRPKKGRRYYSANGTFVLKVPANATFNWNNSVFGEWKRVQDGRFFLNDGMYDAKYENFSAANYKTLFGNAQAVYFMFQLKGYENRPCIIRVISDEKSVMGGEFKYEVEYGELIVFYDTASPYFKLVKDRAVFVKPVALNLGNDAMKSHMKSFMGFYRKYNNNMIDFAGNKIEKNIGKQWKRVCTKENSVDCEKLNGRIEGEGEWVNYFPVNNQAKLFRFYSCKFNGWKRKYRSDNFIEVFYDKKRKVLKKV